MTTPTPIGHRIELPHTGLARSLSRTHGFEPLRVEGDLPAELAGTLFRNGPGVFEGVDGLRHPHLFDGDGAISAVRFGAGRAEGAVRLVQTAGRGLERDRGRVCLGNYGTVSPRPMWDFFFGAPKNVANTSLLRRGADLLALWEGGMPTALDPATLTTRGPSDLGGAVRQSFSAHPHRVPARRCTYNFGLFMGLRPAIDLFELPDDGPTRRIGRVPLPHNTLLHDCAVTARHFVFFVSPLRLHLLDLMRGRRAYCDALDWVPAQGTRVIVVPIDAPDRIRRFTVEPFFQWHMANAFDDGDAIVIDLVRYPDFAINRWLQRLYAGLPVGGTEAEFGRARIVGERFDYTTLLDRSVEFPVIAPGRAGRRQRYTWIGGHSSRAASALVPLDVLVRFDHETGDEIVWDPGPGRFPSEPVFAPRPGAPAEDDGWLLTTVYDIGTDRSWVTVLDADDMQRGPRARVCFDQPLPQTFHGIWWPA